MSEYDSFSRFLVDFYKDYIPIKAVNPEFGGEGELERAKFLESLLRKIGVDEIKQYDIPDKRAKGGIRPNIITYIYGKNTNKTFWIIGHMDVVPEGDKSLWLYDPWSANVNGDYIYGRGTEDDGQGIATGLLVLKMLRDYDIMPNINLGIAFVSDEEAGSNYGAKYLAFNTDVFKQSDEILIPDAGYPEGDKIEVAEKHILWLKIKALGKQAHASTPEKGINAHRLNMEFVLSVYHKIHERFNKYNELFDPPVTTCEPTKKEKNIDNINTIPGVDIVYMDCRILTDYDPEELLDFIREEAYNFSLERGCKIDVEVVSQDIAPKPTDPNSEFVRNFIKSLKEVRNIEARPIGIGGGTVAKYFREKGIPTIVWMTTEGTAHEPNERVKISNIINDARVIFYYLTSKKV